jgi:hypothetical protein
MRKYGDSKIGYSYDDTINIFNFLKNKNYKVKFIKLHELIECQNNEDHDYVSLIIFRNGLSEILNDEINVVDRFLKSKLFRF